MKKASLFGRASLLALLLLPALVMAQHYNNLHRFATDYTRSANTCAIELAGSKIVEGGTVRNSNSTILNSVELGIVDPSTGTLGVHPLTYSYLNHNHTAADLIESLGDPGQVVCAANMNSPFAASTMVSVFKTDPSSGSVDWSLLYTNPAGSQVANAITRDNEKNYYVLGSARINGRDLMYLLKVDDGGNPIWERYYSSAVTNEVMRGIDLIFDGTSVVVVANLTNSQALPGGRGIVVAQINPVNGLITNIRNLRALASNPELKARDITLVGGRYVIVGEQNPGPFSPVLVPQRGFMVSYDPALNVAATRIYGDPNGNNLRVTGVRPNFFTGTLFMTYDLGTNARAVWIPGLMETDLAGKVNAASIYRVKGYLGTNGLINVNSFFVPGNVMIKGSVNSNSIPGAPSLSLIGDGPFISIDSNICQHRYDIKNEDVKYINDSLNFITQRAFTATKIDLIVEKIDGRTYDCHGNGVGSFRLAPEDAEEEVAEENGFEVYPNPSGGAFFLRLEEGQVAAYRSGEVVDLMGKTITTFNINSTNLSIDLSGQAPGIYLLRMKSDDGQVSETKRLMIK